MNYLAQTDIENINRGIHPKTGYSVLNAGALQEATMAPGREMFGVEMNKLLGEKAAALVYPIAQSHVFQDANKRTAYLALVRFLTINGYQIIPNYIETVKDLIGQCAANPAIDKAVLSGRLQVNFIKQNVMFI